MKQALRTFILFICSITLSGCVSQSKPPSIAEPVVAAPDQYNTTMSKVIAVAPFDQVVFSGPINAIINGHQAQTQLQVTGIANGMKSFSTKVHDGILYISYGAYPLNSNGNVPLQIKLDIANTIHKISYDGNGQLITKNIGDSSLSLDVAGNSTISMNGNLVLSQIRARNNAVVHAYWLNTSHLQIITSNKAKVFIAGIATDLNLIAVDDSDIDAKYLRVQNAYIRTKDNADVGINVKRALSTWSTEHSSVYYYQDPKFSTNYLDNSSAALRMVGLPKN